MAYNPSEADRLFQAAFAKQEPKIPQGRPGAEWRINATKMRSLSFQELYQLQEYYDANVDYNMLPAWVLDGNYVEMSSDTKKREKALSEQDGLTTSERRQVWDAGRIAAEAIGDMAELDSLKGTDMLLKQYSKAVEKFGADTINDVLKAYAPDAHGELSKMQAVKNAEAKQAEIVAAAESDEHRVRREIEEAKAAIEAMNAQTGLEGITDEQLQRELTRRASIATHQAAENTDA